MKLKILRAIILNNSVATAGSVVDIDDEELVSVLIGSNKAIPYSEEEKKAAAPMTTENQSSLVKGKKKKDD